MKHFTKRINAANDCRSKFYSPAFHLFRLLLEINLMGFTAFLLFTLYETLLNIKRLSEIFKASVISNGRIFKYIILETSFMRGSQTSLILFWSLLCAMLFILIFGLFIGNTLKRIETTILEKVSIDSYTAQGLLHLVKILYMIIGKVLLIHSCEIVFSMAIPPSGSVINSLMNPLCFVIAAASLLAICLFKLLLFHRVKFYSGSENLAWTCFSVEHELIACFKKALIAFVLSFDINPSFLLVYLPLSLLSLRYKIHNRGFRSSLVQYLIILTELVESSTFIIFYLSYLDMLDLNLANVIVFISAGALLSASLLSCYLKSLASRGAEFQNFQTILYELLEKMQNMKDPSNRTFLLGYFSNHIRICINVDCNCVKLNRRLQKPYASELVVEVERGDSEDFMNSMQISGQSSEFYNYEFWCEFWTVLFSDLEKGLTENKSNEMQGEIDYELISILYLVRIDLLVFKLNKPYEGLYHISCLNSLLEGRVKGKRAYFKYVYLRYNLFLLEYKIQDLISNSQKNNLTYIAIFMEIILYNHHYEAFLEALISMTQLTREFLVVLQEQRANRSKTSQVKRLKETYQRIDSKRREMIENFTVLNDSHSEEFIIYFLYSKFCEAIYLLPSLKRKYYDKFELNFKHHLTESSLISQSLKSSSIKIFSRKATCGVVILSGNQHSAGRILYTNNVLEDLVRHRKETLLRKNVNTIMAHSVGKYHNHFIRNFHNNKTSNILDRKRQVFLKCRDGFVLSVNILIKILPNFVSGISFIGLISRTNIEAPGQGNFQIGYIICNETLHVVGISREIFFSTGFSPEFIPPSAINKEDSDLNHIERICRNFKFERTRLNAKTYEELTLSRFSLPNRFEVHDGSSSEEDNPKKKSKGRSNSLFLNSKILAELQLERQKTKKKENVGKVKINAQAVRRSVGKSPEEIRRKGDASYVKFIENFSQKEKYVMEEMKETAEREKLIEYRKTQTQMGRKSTVKSDTIATLNSASYGYGRSDSEGSNSSSQLISRNIQKKLDNIDLLLSFNKKNHTSNLTKMDIEKIRFLGKIEKMDIRSISLNLTVIKLKIYSIKTESEDSQGAKPIENPVVEKGHPELGSNASMSVDTNSSIYLNLLNKKESLSNGGLFGKRIINESHSKITELAMKFEGSSDFSSLPVKALFVIYLIFSLAIISLIALFLVNHFYMLDVWFDQYKRKLYMHDFISFTCSKIQMYLLLYTSKQNILVDFSSINRTSSVEKLKMSFEENYSSVNQTHLHWDNSLDKRLQAYLDYNIKITDKTFLAILDIPDNALNDRKFLLNDEMPVCHVNSKFELGIYNSSLIKQVDYYDHIMQKILKNASVPGSEELYDFRLSQQRDYFEILFNEIEFMSKYIYEYLHGIEQQYQELIVIQIDHWLLFLYFVIVIVSVFLLTIGLLINSILIVEDYIFMVFLQVDLELLEFRRLVVEDYFKFFSRCRVIHQLKKNVKVVLIKEINKLDKIEAKFRNPCVKSSPENANKKIPVKKPRLLEKTVTVSEFGNSNNQMIQLDSMESQESLSDAPDYIKYNELAERADNKGKPLKERKLTREMCKIQQAPRQDFKIHRTPISLWLKVIL